MLDENDIKKIQELLGVGFSAFDARLKAFEAKAAEPKPEPKAESKPEPKADSKESASDAAKNQAAEMTKIQAELRRMAVEKNLPPNVIPERVGIMVKVLEADGRLLTRDGAHVLRVERNGQMVDVPLADGLKEYAGTREADPFVRAATAGTGAQPSHAAPGGTGSPVSVHQVLSAALAKIQ